LRRAIAGDCRRRRGLCVFFRAVGCFRLGTHGQQVARDQSRRKKHAEHEKLTDRNRPTPRAQGPCGHAPQDKQPDAIENQCLQKRLTSERSRPEGRNQHERKSAQNRGPYRRLWIKLDGKPALRACGRTAKRKVQAP